MSRVLSRRERLIVIGSAAALGILVADRYVLRPVFAEQDRLERAQASLRDELDRNHQLLRRRRELSSQWNAMQGNLHSSPAAAESAVLHAVRDAAEASGVRLALQRPERLSGPTRLPEIAFRAAGTGSMEAVAAFLGRLEGAEVALCVTELQLSSRKEGTDDLSVQLRLSTLWLPPDRQGPAAGKTALARAGREEAQ